MKSITKVLVFGILAVVVGTSCKKTTTEPQSVTKTVTLDQTLKPGETYSLDLSAYSSQKDQSSITKDAGSAAESRLTAGSCHSSATYLYTAGTADTTDQVVLQITKHPDCSHSSSTGTGDSKGGFLGLGGNNSCTHSSSSEDHTVITINFTIKTPTTTTTTTTAAR